MKTGAWVAAVLVVLAIGFYIAPHEAVGYVSGEAGYCKVKMDIGRYSPSALFKTFACSETADSKDCYYLVYDGETCTTSYHYHEDH